MNQGSRIGQLLGIMERLRGAQGCAWDRAQTAPTLVPYTIEEAYEVADAVERGDLTQLRDELGDLLFQVVFHAQIARETGQFDFEDVAGAIAAKLIRRHPHVFHDEAPLDVSSGSVAAERALAWEDIKALERAGEASSSGIPVSALAGVPTALPALMRAIKLSKRAARVGFDFEHAAATADKVAEELEEVRQAAGGVGADARARVFEETGDLLFAVANLARKLDVDAEAAMRAANLKFERRFLAMEKLAKERGLDFSELELKDQESLWREVKLAE